MSTQPLPERLQKAVEEDWHAVHPLPPAWQRSLSVVAVVLVISAVALTTLKLRFDLGEIPLWLSWGCSLFELAAGIILVAMSLREAVPGDSLSTRAVAAALTAGLALQVLVGLATWMHSPGMAYGTGAVGMGMGCLKHDGIMALPTFIVTLWLVFRALPLRAPVAGILGGAGAAITADAITHLQCPMSDLRHVLIWHTGAIFLFVLLGYAVGKFWERRRLLEMSSHSE